jgi:hypothetical protein
MYSNSISPIEEAPPELRPPEWPFQVGDMVSLELKERGINGGIKRHRGRVVALAPQVMTVDVGKYRVSVARWAWWAGYAKVARLA